MKVEHVTLFLHKAALLYLHKQTGKGCLVDVSHNELEFCSKVLREITVGVNVVQCHPRYVLVTG